MMTMGLAMLSRLIAPGRRRRFAALVAGLALGTVLAGDAPASAGAVAGGAGNACPPEICTTRLRTPPERAGCGPVIIGGRVVYSLGGCLPAPRRACPRVHAPVCGRIGRMQRTYANDCEAGRAGARVLYRGTCVAEAPPPRLTPPRVCPQIHAPVCGRDRQGRVRTYSNDCMAAAAEARVLHPGPCR